MSVKSQRGHGSGSLRRGDVSAHAVAAILLMVWLIFSLAAGLRWLGYGRDYIEYWKFYETVTFYFLYGYSRFELGFEAAAWFASNLLNMPFELFFIALAATSIAIKFRLFSDYLGSTLFAAIAYLLLFYPIHEYTQIRSAVAIGFGYYAVHKMLERRLVYAGLLMLVAFLFHSSSVLIGVVALAAFFTPKKYYWLFAFGGIVLGIALGQSILDFIGANFSELNPLTDSYLDNTSGSDPINILSGSNVLHALTLATVAALGWQARDQYNMTFFIMGVSGLAVLVLFQSSPILALRSSEMLLVSTIFLAYRPGPSWQAAPVQLLVLINGLWSTYRAIIEGTLG